MKIKNLKRLLLITGVMMCISGITNAQSPNNAFGDNQIEIEPGIFAIYSGDITQDGAVDFSDAIEMDNALTNFDGGYVPCDLDGTGAVDFLDAILIDNALTNFVASIKPI